MTTPNSKILRAAAGSLLRRIASTAGVPVPGAPRSVAATNTGPSAASITWTEPTTGAELVAGYRTVVSISGQLPFITTHDVEARSQNLTDLVAVGTYTVSVTALNAAGVSGPATLATLMMSQTTASAPGPPVAVTATSSAPDSIVLTWRAPTADGGSPLTGYRVGRDGTDTGGTINWNTVIGPEGLPGAGLGIEFLYLLPATTYNVYVAAINAQGEGPRVTVPVTTRPQTETDPTKEHMPYLSFDRTPWKEGMKLDVAHEMAIYQTWDNNEFPLILQGNIASDADRTALASGLTMADTGKFWRVTSTGKCWVWVWTLSATSNSGTFVDYGVLPAYTVSGVEHDNPRGYMTKNFKPIPVGVAGRESMVSMGGMWRDWWPADPRRHSDQNVYAVENALKRIRDASEAGLNALALHSGELPSQGPAWQRTVYFLTAAERFNAEQVAAGSSKRFYWLPSFDGLTGTMSSVRNADGTINQEASAQALAAECLKLKDRTGWLKIDGRWAFFPFGSHLNGTVEQRKRFWDAFEAALIAGGMPPYLILGVLNDWKTLFDPQVSTSISWRGIPHALSDWGARDPQSALSTSHRMRGMTDAVQAALGIGNWTTVAPTDVRYWSQFGAPSWHEGRGFLTLKNTWAMAHPPINGDTTRSSAAGVQRATTNDFAEGSEQAVTVKKGHTIYDICGYWQEWWRTGVKPTMTRPVIYVAHRNQFKDDPTYPMTFTGKAAPGQVSPVVQQTSFTSEKAQNQTPIANEIFAMVDIPYDWTGPINIRCSISGVEQIPLTGSMTAQPNVRNEVSWRLKPGRVKVWIERSGAIVQDYVSPEPVSQTQPVEDLTYFMGTSSRQSADVAPPPAAEAPSVPLTVTTSGITHESATLNWQPPSSAGSSAITGYRVSRDGSDSGGGGAWSVVLPATARSQTFTLLKASTTYNLSVAAVNAAGAGVAATLVAVTSAAPVQPGVVLPPPGGVVRNRLVGVNGLITAGHAAYSTTQGSTPPAHGVTSSRLYIARDAAMTIGLRRTAAVTPNGAGYSRHVHGCTAAGWHYFRVATTVDGVEKIDSFTSIGRIFITDPAATSITVHGASCAVFGGGPAFAAASRLNDPTGFFMGDAHYHVRPDTLTEFRWWMQDFWSRTGVHDDFSHTKLSVIGSDHDSLENDNTGLEQPSRWANWNRAYREILPIDVAPLTLLGTGGPAVGVNHTWDEGPVRFIALDTRSMRSSWRIADSATKTYLGAAQEAWFENLIDTMPAGMVAFVIGDNNMNGPEAPGGGVDGWRGYPTARRRFAAVMARRPSIYVAGDVHCLRYDDGSRNAAGNFPLCHAAPWYTPTATVTSSTTNAEQWSGGSYPIPTMDGSIPYTVFGRWEFNRTATSISMTFSGINQNGTRVFGPHVKTWPL